MSATVAQSLVGETIIGGIHETAYLYLRDFDATADDVLSAKFNDRGRSPINVTVEVTGFNYLVAKMLKGEKAEMPNAQEREEFAAKLNTREAAKAAFEDSVKVVTEAAATLTDAEWAEKLMAPWGREISKAHMANWLSFHAMYHDGQINYVQTLHGDEEMHWM